jgi:hypothetical protein
MAEPVRVRRLTDQEGRRLLQIVRRGKHGSARVRRAMIIMASASGTLVPAIARLVAADEDTVRDVIHTFNAKGLAALDPRWAGGRPRLISDGDIEVIVTAARDPAGEASPAVHPVELAQAGRVLSGPGPAGADRAGAAAAAPSRARHLLAADPDLAGIRRSGPGRQAGPDRVRDQRLPGPLLRLRPVRAAAGPALPRRVPGAAQTAGPAIRRWARRENAGLCFTPANASWANPVEAQSGPVRTFVMGGSDHRNHPALARKLQDYLRWRNAHARHPDVLAAQRRERARLRSERQQRWGRPKPKAA